jgi:hypothetical protein
MPSHDFAHMRIERCLGIGLARRLLFARFNQEVFAL